MIVPLPNQVKFSQLCWEVLKEKGYVYLAGKPRSGKTYTAILTAEMSDKINNVLVLTAKAAISGWTKFIDGNELLQHNYHVTNYAQVGRIKTIGKKTFLDLKLNAEDYDLVIIDESHNLGVIGKPTARIKLIKQLCYTMPHIHLSGTAIVESPNSIYSQMSISEYSPFNHKSFYEFFNEFGLPYYIKVMGRDMMQYDRCKIDTLMPLINQFTVYMTQEDAGISKDLQAIDKLHYVTLNDATRKLYNELQTDFISNVDVGMLHKDMAYKEPKYELVCDSTMKLRTSLHMIEGGVCKVDDKYIILGNTEKIDYIRNTFGDVKGVGIMCHFIGEQMLIKEQLKNVEVYSSKAHAEGVDLSHLDTFIILSSDYSGSKFIQRRERIINTNGSNTTTVHHILVKGAISEQVYKKVSKKEDFNNSTYERTSL